MKSLLLGLGLSVRRWSRVARRLGAFGASVCCITTALAQNLAFNTLAGTPGVDGFSNSAPIRFNNPYGVAVDAAGNVYVADTGNHVIRKIAAGGGGVTTLVGAAGSSGSADDATANAPSARFNAPQGIAINAAGDRLYVADTGNHTIRVIALTAAGGSVTGVATLAGQAGSAGSSNTGAGLFNTPRGIAADTVGNLYIADTGNHQIRRVVITPVAVTTVAGLAGTAGAVNGDNTTATFNSPYGIAVNSTNDTLYVADFNNHLVRRIALTTPVAVTTLAGTSGTAAFIDGNGTAAAFRNPTGVSVNAGGSVLVVDFGNNALRQISSAAGNAVTTIAGPAATGSSTAGAAGTSNGTGNAVRFTGPVGVTTKTVSGVEYVYIADTNNHLVRQGAVPSLPTVGAASPATQTAAVGATGITFTSTVTGGWPTPTLQWQVQPGGVGSFTNLAASSTYTNVNTATLTINNVTATMNNDKYRLVATTSAAVEGAAATLTVNQAPVFASSTVNFTAVVGRANTFIVAASGTAPITYTGALGTFALNLNGTITGTPLSTSEATSATITATNSVGTATQTVTINVVPETSAAAPTVTSASSATFVVGQSNNFTFTASGAPTPIIGLSGTLPPGVTFLNGLLSGTPLNADTTTFPLTVTATNSVGSATQTFTLSVSAATASPSFVAHPQNTIGNLGQTATFTATVTGSPGPTVRWQRQAASSGGGFADLFDDAVFSGTTTNTLTIQNLEAGMSGDQFRLVATNVTSGTTNVVPSNSATLTVNIGTVISTFVGQGGLAGSNDGLGAAARFNTPGSIAVDTTGNFYVADAANNVIRKITPGGVVTTLAGSPGVSGNADGSGAGARFTAPSAVAVNAVGTVFVADTFNHTIRAISPAGVVTTIAGLANNSGSTNGTGSAARFAFPSGIAADASGSVYVADSGNHAIRRINPAGEVTVLSGTLGVAGSTDATAGASARYNYPTNLALDASGNLYVADSMNHTIRRVNIITGAATTIAGTAGVAGALDANGTAATFNRPNGVAADNSGNVYVADTSNNTIRRITSSGVVTTLAGSVGQSGTSDGAGAQARFNQPFALTVDPNGNLYIADSRNHTIRRSGTTSAPSITAQPQNRTVPLGASTTFTVVATGTPTPSYQWQRQPAGTTGFVNLANGGSYSGVTTATLAVSNLLSSYSGDQFRVVVSNGISPNATSEAASLTIGDTPVFTSANTATIRAGDPLSFTFTASGSPAATFTATGLPRWLSLSAATGVLSGTPPVGSEGNYTLAVTANNGATATQTFTLTVTPAIIAPAITSQPVALSVNQGQSATFTVAATGTAPLSYQWRRNGVAISGATASSYTIASAQPAHVGSYSVTITNPGGSLASNAAELVVNTAPSFTLQPRTQLATAGSTVTFSTAASGGTSFNYQWRRNGVPIAGATNATHTVSNVSAAEVGIYDVVVSNALGSIISSVAQLSLATAPSAPVITAQPASRAVLAGGATMLSASAVGVPAPTFQWRKNGQPIAGATNPTLVFSVAQTTDGGDYDVVITNANGSVTTNAANLRVITRSYAGIYVGALTGGSFALHVRDDNTGVFLGFLTSANAPVWNLNVGIGDNGEFGFSQAAVGTALQAVTVNGTIATTGVVSGSITGGATATINGVRTEDGGSTREFAGYYQAGSTTNSAVAHVIAGTTGQSYALLQSGNVYDGSPGTVSPGGVVTVSTGRTIFTGTITPATGTLTGTATGAISATFSGGSEATVARQRLANISSRARVGTADAVAIAGFVISGEESKPVLIRAVGPTLGAAPFSVPGVLASPRLELFRAGSTTALATNTGIAANRTVIDAASQQAGAFALGTSGADAAIFTTLPPGNYTAVVSSTTNATGVALIEVYDLSAPTPGQKLLNISTRASGGTAENTLIAGFVVPAGPAKRVLVRGIGPGLAQFGVPGVLPQPTLTLLRGATTVAQNSNWSASSEAAAITAASAQVGAFSLAAQDAAVIVTLEAGNYTAQVLGAGGASGIALIEVYELP